MTYQDVSALQKNEELSNALHYSQKRDEELTKALKALGMVFTNIFIVHLEDQDSHSGIPAAYNYHGSVSLSHRHSGIVSGHFPYPPGFLTILLSDLPDEL